jgi:prepilin-type N-terminal cleavage/methylation domain-containing protein
MIPIRLRSARRAAAARTSPRPRRGFTIVEMLLAIMLLSVGMLAMAGMLRGSSRLQRLSLSRAELTTLAEAKIEELRSYGQTPSVDPLRANLAIGGSTTSNETAYADSVTGLNNVKYYRRWQVSAGFAGARLVQVRVLPAVKPLYHLPKLDLTSTVLLQ